TLDFFINYHWVYSFFKWNIFRRGEKSEGFIIAAQTKYFLVLPAVLYNWLYTRKELRFYLFKIQHRSVRSILKLKYDTTSNVMHQEVFNKLKLLTVSNRLFELNERYFRAALSHVVPLVIRLVEEYRVGFESGYIEYPTPLSINLIKLAGAHI
ncbi:hypothetical protein BpHYR1_036090, partial [Brachionus plicatilis]